MLLSPHPFLQDLWQLTLLCPHPSQVLVFSWSSASLLRIPSQDDPSFGQLLWICTLEPNTCHDTCDLISFTSFFGVQFQMHSFDYCSIVAQQHYGNFSSSNWGAKLFKLECILSWQFFRKQINWAIKHTGDPPTWKDVQKLVWSFFVFSLVQNLS